MDYTEIVEDMRAGKIDALKCYAILKDIKKDFDTVLNMVEKEAQEYAENYEDKFEAHGYKFEKRRGGRMWDFKHIEEWKEVDQAKKDIEEKYKNAYNQKYGHDLISVTNDGEELELPILKYKKDSLIVK